MSEQQQAHPTTTESELIAVRRDKLAKIRELGIDPYGARFDVTTTPAGLKADFQEDKQVAVAGRLLAIRDMGKSQFFVIGDVRGKIQGFLHKNEVDETTWKLWKLLDRGDWVGIRGTTFLTRTGEPTVKVSGLTILSKSLRPLPDKWHGLADKEVTYRKRHLDLISNEESASLFVTRSLMIAEIRRFLQERGYLEVETPMLQDVAGGAAAKPFETYHNALDMPLTLRIAPELFLKRLMVGGFTKIFELNRSFRNEGIDRRHNPEFTSCEFYWAYANFHDLMDLTEELFARLANKVCGGTVITYQGQEIDLTPGKWTRMSFYESLTKIGGHSPEFYNDYNKVRDYIRSRGEKATDSESLPKLHAKLFDLDVEEKLIQPHFIYHYPTEISPLSRRNNEHPDLTDRFELFITGRELANAFSELNDPVDQRLRFEEQVREKEAGDDEAHAMDEDFLRALEYGMPPAAGEGIGIDRLVMLLTDSASIREVILFPLLRPEF